MRLRDRHHAHQLEWPAFGFQIRVTSTESMHLDYMNCVFKIHNHVYLIYTNKRGIFKSDYSVIRFYGLMKLVSRALEQEVRLDRAARARPRSSRPAAVDRVQRQVRRRQVVAVSCPLRVVESI